MEKDKKLPVYKLRVSEKDANNLSVDFISLVDEPAILVDWQMFNKQVKFSADTDRRLIMGPLMIATMPIYRRDTERGEYYVVFDKDEIYKIVQKFFRNGLTSNFNIMHGDDRADNIYLIESFIIDESRGVKAPEAFKDLPEGSWLATVKVDNDKVWQEFIKTGELKGFSIQGLFSYEKVSDTPQSTLEEIVEIVIGS